MPTRCTSNRCPIHWKSKRITPDGASLIRPTKIYLSPRRPEDVYVAIRHLSPVGASLIRPTKIYLSPCRPDKTFTSPSGISHLMALRLSGLRRYTSRPVGRKTFTSPSGISHLMALRLSGLRRYTSRPVGRIRRLRRHPASLACWRVAYQGCIDAPGGLIKRQTITSRLSYVQVDRQKMAHAAAQHKPVPNGMVVGNTFTDVENHAQRINHAADGQ